MAEKVKYWAVIPAAGMGNRMGTEIPKQYLRIRDRCILEHVLSRFIEIPVIERIVVVVSDNDTYWPGLDLSRHKKVTSTIGGKERYHSVLNGLQSVVNTAGEQDWVLVHDAARACVRADDIRLLIESLSNHPVGGLLGLPVRDTMKQTDTHNEITGTISRDGLWHALTPQMFRLGALKKAIKDVIDKNLEITDEAQAMEIAGFKPKFIQGHPDNIKITHKNDLPLAELYLLQQENHL